MMRLPRLSRPKSHRTSDPVWYSTVSLHALFLISSETWTKRRYMYHIEELGGKKQTTSKIDIVIRDVSHRSKRLHEDPRWIVSRAPQKTTKRPNECCKSRRNNVRHEPRPADWTRGRFEIHRWQEARWLSKCHRLTTIGISSSPSAGMLKDVAGAAHGLQLCPVPEDLFLPDDVFADLPHPTFPRLFDQQ